MEVGDSDTIVVWFSCGAASAVAAKMTIETYPNASIRIVNNPVDEEDADNRRFLVDVSTWIGHPIEMAYNEKYPDCSAVEVWEKRKYMSGVAGAPCTVELKKEARRQWETRNNPDWHVLGFTANEKARYDRFVIGERENTLPVLIDRGITKADCFAILKKAGVKLPRIYEQGYPNANCIGCVKASSPTYWNHVRAKHPETFNARANQSRTLGARLVRVKGERIFLDELKTTDTGKPMKNMDIECGIFCEERG